MTPEEHRTMELGRRAQQAASQGRFEDAVELWRQVSNISPDHPEAKLRSAVCYLNIAQIRRQARDVAGELQAYDNALASDPYCYPAILDKAEALERLGKKRLAARHYKDAIEIAPPVAQLPPQISAKISRARAAVEENARSMGEFLRNRLKDARTDHPGQKMNRFDDCVDIALGTKKIYNPKPTLLHYPGLPAIEFYDETEFPNLAALQSQTDAIRDELIALLQHDSEPFTPYVTHPDGVPLNQWAELNFSPRWGAFFLWKDGKRVADNCLQCPRTAAALDATGMADVPGYAPTAFFSLLQPHTHIPPHTGVTNTRLIVHLPLVVPHNCRFRVGNDTRAWELGKPWVFDDTIEHEAWNDSESVRVLLIFDIWNPYLSSAERSLIPALLQGVDDYYRSE